MWNGVREDTHTHIVCVCVWQQRDICTHLLSVCVCLLLHTLCASLTLLPHAVSSLSNGVCMSVGMSLLWVRHCEWANAQIRHTHISAHTHIQRHTHRHTHASRADAAFASMQGDLLQWLIAWCKSAAEELHWCWKAPVLRICSFVQLLPGGLS